MEESIKTQQGLRPKCKICNKDMLAVPVHSLPTQSNYYCGACHKCYQMTESQRKMEYELETLRRA